MADHFEEVVGLRVSALEARADAEEKALKEFFLEQQQFITFSLQQLAETLRTEWRTDLSAFRTDWRADLDAFRTEWRSELGAFRTEWRTELGAFRTEVRTELGTFRTELNALRGEVREVHQRIDSVEEKMDGHHAATETALQEILRRLPPAAA